MRLLWWRLKNFTKGFCCLCLVAAFGMVTYALNACKLRSLDGERTFYLYSASSQGLKKSELTLRDFSNICGESVRFSVGEEDAETLALGIAEQYEARVVFTEKVGGVQSYYCYTQSWDNGLELNGCVVNLQVAISGEECVVGTPIIFGGF